MEHIGIHETKTNLSQLVKRLALGEEFAITNRGHVVGYLKPPVIEKQARMRAVLDGLKALSASNKPCSMEDILSWRKMGQK